MGGLAEILLSMGGPVLARAIGRKFGGEMGNLTADALDALGKAFGTEPSEPAIADAIHATPSGEAMAKVRVAEADMAGILAAYAETMRAGNDQQRMTNELLQAQLKEPGWRSDWLYVWQWFLMAAWAWTIFVVHILNAVLRLTAGAGGVVSLPAPDPGILMTLTAVYLGLHMGGHTVLELMRNQFGGLFGKDRVAE